MPVVLGTQQVPSNIPRPTGFDYLGQFQGTSARQVADALLAALTRGMYQPRVPVPQSPQFPGSLSFPGGGTQPAGYDPSQIGPFGGPRTPTTAQTSRNIQIPAEAIVGYGQRGGVQYNPPPRLTLEQLQAMQVQQKMQQDADPNSPLNQFLVAQAGRMRGEQASPTQRASSIYQVGDVLERAGKRWKVVGFDEDGTPLVDPE